jgi:hypothetical protein
LEREELWTELVLLEEVEEELEDEDDGEVDESRRSGWVSSNRTSDINDHVKPSAALTLCL